MLRNEQVFENEYVFYADIDLGFIRPIGQEILPPNGKGIIAVRHAGFWRGGGSWENREESTAYVPPDLRRHYYAGGFQGGDAKSYKEVVQLLAERVKQDNDNGIMAVWHDESHWNKFIAMDLNPMWLKELTPSYCYPGNVGQAREWGVWDFTPVIVALDKNHAEIRS